MINSHKVNPSKNLKKFIQNLITTFKNLMNLNDSEDNSPNKVQYLAQRIDGKKVPVNRKF